MKEETAVLYLVPNLPHDFIRLHHSKLGQTNTAHVRVVSVVDGAINVIHFIVKNGINTKG
jgi:hypothetical protein